MSVTAEKSKGPPSAVPYTEYHPRWYRRKVSVYWWLGQWRYLKFILREISSVFVAIFVVITLVGLRALEHGPEAYARFEAWLRTPFAIGLNLVSLFFVLFHAITWFNLAPHAMAVRVRGRRVPALVISAPNYLAWALASALVAWMVWR
jgi:fumarate reductase subunit C